MHRVACPVILVRVTKHPFLFISVGGGHSIDVIDSGSGSDLASGDCVWIQFDSSDYHVRNVSSTSINVGGMDELRMGEGERMRLLR